MNEDDTAELMVMEDRQPTLEEAQSAVGGLAERVFLSNGDHLLVNEEGLLLGLPVNIEATLVAGMPIVGNALLLKGKARWIDEDDDEEEL